jgi:hypothetical protein
MAKSMKHACTQPPTSSHTRSAAQTVPTSNDVPPLSHGLGPELEEPTDDEEETTTDEEETTTDEEASSEEDDEETAPLEGGGSREDDPAADDDVSAAELDRSAVDEDRDALEESPAPEEEGARDVAVPLEDSPDDAPEADVLLAWSDVAVEVLLPWSDVAAEVLLPGADVAWDVLPTPEDDCPAEVAPEDTDPPSASSVTPASNGGQLADVHTPSVQEYSGPQSLSVSHSLWQTSTPNSAVHPEASTATSAATPLPRSSLMPHPNGRGTTCAPGPGFAENHPSGAGFQSFLTSTLARDRVDRRRRSHEVGPLAGQLRLDGWWWNGHHVPVPGDCHGQRLRCLASFLRSRDVCSGVTRPFRARS